MKRFLTTSLILLALTLGAMSTAPVAQAQDAANPDPGILIDPTTGSAYSQASIDATNAASQSGVSQAVADMAKQDPKAAATPSIFQSGPQIDDSLAKVITWITQLFAWMVGVAAITLDNAVYYTVVTMGDYVRNLAAIGITWRILRDIGNILFIFGFLAVGIATILNTDWYGIRKMLPMLLVGAIFINFSLFFSEAIIDAGNLFATQFYTQINGGTPAGAKNFDLDSIKNEGIASKLMNQLGLQGIYASAITNGVVLSNSSSILIGFMSIILFLTTAFVMFSLAFILIARFVALIFLIIVAPVGFAGLAIPGFAARAKQWWALLFEQTVTAPILMLMLYIALAVITDAKFIALNGNSEPDWTGFITSSNGSTDFAGFAGIILSFLVAMGLLLLVIVYSKRWSAFGGDWATKTAGKLTFGLTGWGMRNSVGRLSQGLSRRVGRVPFVGKPLQGALGRGAKASFDFRGIETLKSIPLVSGVNLGAANKGGFREMEKKKIKEHEEFAESLQQTGKEKKQQKEAERRKTMMENTVEDIKRQNNSEMEALRKQHKNDIEPFNNQIEAERANFAAAQASGNADAIRAATFSLNTALADQAQKRDEQKREQEKLKSVHDQLVKVQEEEVKVHQTEVERLKKAPQMKYAERLNLYIDQNKGGFFRRTVNFINPYANSKAADKIRDAAGKSKAEKDTKILLDILERQSQPAPAAPGGAAAGGAHP
ncbi:hypothetical protein KGM48_00195 [Patescibacteria group bacterium]|nr:hypothetical protein [Patescibacteria group bacterium]